MQGLKRLGRSSALERRLLAVRGLTPADTMIAVKPVAEALGLDWSAQLKHPKRNEVLVKGAVEMAASSAGGMQAMTAIPLSQLAPTQAIKGRG